MTAVAKAEVTWERLKEAKNEVRTGELTAGRALGARGAAGDMVVQRIR